MKILHSKRLTLRAYRPEDEEAFVHLVCAQEVIKFLQSESDSARCQELARERFAKILRHYLRTPDPVETTWAVTLREKSEQLIGHCELRSSSYGWGRELEMNLLVIPQYWGRGYGTELATLIVRYGLEDLGLDAVLATVHAENNAALRVLEKIGMEPLRERESQSGPIRVYAARRI